jgi:hypothetical protein
MLHPIPDVFREIDSRFLKPACRNRDFLVAIPGHKINAIKEVAH